MLVIFAYGLMILTIGSFSYYAVEYFEDVFQVSTKVREVELEISMVIAAITGFLAGGIALDLMKDRRLSSHKQWVLSGVKIALLCIVIITPLSVVFASIVKVAEGLTVVSIIYVLVFICMGAFNCVVL